MGKKIDMRMIGARLSYLISQTEIGWAKQVQLLDDRIMVKPAVLGIVDNQPSLTTLRIIAHSSFSFVATATFSI